MNRFAALALLLAASCATRAPKRDLVPELGRLALLEDSRNPAIPDAFISSNLTAVRERAAVAFGRIMDPQAIPSLRLLAADADPSVRKAALFAMGQLGLGPEALAAPDLDPLLKAVTDGMKHPEEAIRATAVEALGKLALQEAPLLAIQWLKDPSALVRRQAASACFRWQRILRMRDPSAKPGDLPNESLVALCDTATRDRDGEVRWRAVHAILQSGARPPVLMLEHFLKDSEPLSRLFALMIAERLKLWELADSVETRVNDEEAFVRQAAVRALAGMFAGTRGDDLQSSAADSLSRSVLTGTTVLADSSHHVREAAADLIRIDGPELETLEKDESVAVRSAALLARVRITGAKAVPHLERAMADRNPLVRIGAVRGAALLKEPGLPLLLKAREDENESVRAAALVVLGENEGSKAWLTIWRALTASGVAERGSAVEALAKRKEPQAVPAAIECFRQSPGREWVEIRETLVDLLAARPPEGTTTFLLEVARTDPAASVRNRAAAVLKRRGVAEVPEPSQEAPSRTPHFDRRFAYNPVVLLETTKGSIEIECYGREAPVHVANFIGLVQKGFYDGLRWHRVVPNFVIQGGDPLGTGWGDAGWSLRAEINPIPYRRGTVGMPRSAGFDTGGCQIFITHLPTPHLDGYYTVFGQVAQGLDVIDRIEVGDRIIQATLKR